MGMWKNQLANLSTILLTSTLEKTSLETKLSLSSTTKLDNLSNSWKILTPHRESCGSMKAVFTKILQRHIQFPLDNFCLTLTLLSLKPLECCTASSCPQQEFWNG